MGIPILHKELEVFLNCRARNTHSDKLRDAHNQFYGYIFAIIEQEKRRELVENSIIILSKIEL